MARQTYFLGLGLALVALAFVITDEFVTSTPGCTERNVKRIRRGMTVGEVEALLGVPPDTFTTLSDKGILTLPWPVLQACLNDPRLLEEDPQKLKELIVAHDPRPPSCTGQEFLDLVEAIQDSLRHRLGSTGGFRLCFSDGERGYPVVCFGRDGRVRWAEWRQFGPGTAPTTSLLDRVRSWLGQ
jgi:hypothetical protein